MSRYEAESLSVSQKVSQATQPTRRKTTYATTRTTVDSEKLEYGCGGFMPVFLPSFALGLEDGCVPTFWLILLYWFGPLIV